MNKYVRFQLKVAAAEIDDGSTGLTFFKFTDGIGGHGVSLRYTYSTNKFQLSLSTGGVLEFPFTLVDEYVGFGIQCLDPVGFEHTGNQIVFWCNNTNVGFMYAPATWVFQTLFLGAMDNVGNEVVDHYFRNIIIGSTPGAADVFNTGNFNAGTVVPPFQSTTGGTFEIISHALHVHNTGAVNSYVLKDGLAGYFIPPPPPLPSDGIILVGDYDWKLAGEPAWVLDHWGLDRLIVSYRGSRRLRDAFLATLVPWSAYSGDSNMFLADVTQEQRGSSNFPQIDLVYTGKRGGILPPDREQVGEQIQQVSGRGPVNPAHTVGCTFISKTSEITVWSRTPIDLSEVNPLEPAALDLMWVTETDVIIWPGTFEALEPLIEANVSACFVARVVTTGTSEEVVPGQYYRATKTKQRLLFPVLT